MGTVVTSQQVVNNKGECKSWDIPSKLDKGGPAFTKGLTAITGQIVKNETVGGKAKPLLADGKRWNLS